MLPTTQEDRTRFFVILFGISARPAGLVDPSAVLWPDIAKSYGLCQQVVMAQPLCAQKRFELFPKSFLAARLRIGWRALRTG